MTSTPVFTASGSGLSFGGLLNSEVIKLRSLRSTVWCYSVIVLITVGLGFLIAAFIQTSPSGAPAMSHDQQQAAWVQAATLGVAFSQLVVAVLGALVITGEYGTGMIRSTLTAVPKRLPALAAKATVFALTTFVIGLIAIVATAALVAPVLSGKGIQVDYADIRVWQSFVGGALYLALVGLLALGLGTIVRSSAGGISSALGVLFVLPIIAQIVASVTQAIWPLNVAALLPSNAGQVFYNYSLTNPVAFGPVRDVLVLDPVQALLVVIGWVAAAAVVACVLFKRRDA